MLATTHRDLTRLITGRVFPDRPKYADAIADAASLPDEVRDIQIGRFGDTIWGRPLQSLTHFCVPYGDEGKLRGYNWHRDDSLWCGIRRWDPRIGDVRCVTEPWVPILGRQIAADHPLAYLVRSIRGRATLDADNLTFPTAAVMAEWAWRAATIGLADGAPSPKVVGCVLHWLQDVCVPHHARAWLLKGHTKTEARAAKAMRDIADRERFYERIATEAGQGSAWPAEPRRLVEFYAKQTWRSGLAGGDPDWILFNGGVATLAFLRRSVLPLLR